MLYLISTPIGNLSDVTLRALEVMRSCDYLLCEDTRQSKILLSHYQIEKPLYSYHKFNEAQKEGRILDDLRSGKVIGFLSDAGSPGIADPGHRLISLAAKEKIPYTVLPGPCAVVAALTLTGWEIDSFQWVGFLPSAESECKKKITEALQYPGITVCYETPHRVIKTLEKISTLAPSRRLCLAREISKMYEEVLHGSANELLEHFQSHAPKGEMVLMIAPTDEKIDFSDLSVEEHVEYLQTTYQLSTKDAIKMVSQLRGCPKSTVYNLIHKTKD